VLFELVVEPCELDFRSGEFALEDADPLPILRVRIGRSMQS
jgi:hypothetical protein